MAAALLGLLACEKVTHENIDEWRTTVEGPEKLLDALQNPEVSADLRAHAAQNLVAMDQTAEVVDALGDMPEDQSRAVAKELVPRLWKDARIAGELDQPTALQRGAKDALFEVREYADEETRGTIDEYLVEWLTGGYYEGRAKSGRIAGKTIIRAIGPSAAPGLLEAARSVIARPPDEEGRRLRLGNELLRGLAYASNPEAVGFLLGLVKSDPPDPTLPRRAMEALYEAYVEPAGGLEPAEPRALEPHVERLVEISRNEDLEGSVLNDALDVLAAVGMPRCLEPFVEMVSYPHAQKAFRWKGVENGLRCGGVEAIIPLAEAFPENGRYARGILERYFWSDALEISSREAVAERARTLLASENWVARVSGVELLGALELPGSAAGDASKIRELADDRTVLRGWWGEQKETPPAKRKKDPTLGKVALHVANSLEEVAKGGGSE